jgi:predicted TIM-barrel enzyme
MNTYRKTFPGKHVFLAVIHVEGGKQALRNAKIAEEEGADGVFLINHSIPYSSLIECYYAVREKLPELWIGLNCLDLGMSAVNVIPKETAGLWIDNAGITEGDFPAVKAQKFVHLRRKSNWNGICFGGVAFKYQEDVVDVAKVARLAVPFADVITTSGVGTGKAADVGKIRKMKEAIGDHPLAIASGITPENVQEYMPHADCFLVATGVSDSHTELNRGRVRALVKALGK